MSLDVWLIEGTACPHCGEVIDGGIPVFEWNITHNLNTMADKADIYKALWRPEELNITQAWDLIDLLQSGLSSLLNFPDYYEKFNPENGWGDYQGLVRFVENYLKACRKYPNARIRVSR